MRWCAGHWGMRPMSMAAAVMAGEMAVVWLLPDPVRGVVSLVLVTVAVTVLLMVGIYSGRGSWRRVGRRP
ncbi:hypothetical protein [Actinoallomurus sp. NPDC050550]|uniref:hypothetical protein n=1 Tax=Actinoallomurus sp. NPDC050550 TaxID=3154937 RepID=UPI003408DC8B